MPFYPIGAAGATPWFTNKSGSFVQGQASVSTGATLGNQLLRLAPVLVTSAFTIAQIGAEFTAAGDANSVFRPAWFADDGTGFPGALVLDPGSISTGTGNAGTVPTAGTPGLYAITPASPPLITPGIYWVGGAIQAAPGTVPTMRTALFGTQFAAGSAGLPGVGAQQVGYTQSSVSGALPAAFNNFATAGSAGTIPRIVFKIQ